MKIGIVGAGISGLSSGNILKDKHEVVLFEKDNQPGGIIKCKRVSDCLFHTVGGHIFNSKNQDVLDWFWSYFDKNEEFVLANRKAQILYKNEIIGYPIENYIYLLDDEIIKKIINELIVLQSIKKKTPLNYDNFEAFLKGKFGSSLYEIYFKPYNEKIWKTDLSLVSMEWLEGKLPMPNLCDIIFSNVVRKEECNMVHAKFYYPKEGGSQFIIDRLKKNLDIRVATDIIDMQLKNNTITIKNEKFDKIIFTGDIRQLPQSVKQLLENGGIDVSQLQFLKSNGTSTLFCETDETETSWLYIPEKFTQAHRIIYTGNFSSTNNRGSSRQTCTVEFSGKVDFEVMCEEIKKLPGNLKALDYNFEPNSYVIQDKNTRKLISDIKRVLEKNNVYLLGRFAEWEYYNMDKCMEAAFNLSQRLG